MAEPIIPIEAAKVLMLANSALLKIGLPLAGAEKDIDYNARFVMEDCIKKVLRSYPWGFATKYAQLTVNNTAPVHGYEYGYTIPTDYIRLLDVTGDNNIHNPKASFCISNSLILTNVNPAYARYVAYVTDVARWPVDFKDAVAALIAAEIAPLSAQTQAMTPSLVQLYQWRLTAAQNVDSTETNERVPMDTDIYMARSGKATQE